MANTEASGPYGAQSVTPLLFALPYLLLGLVMVVLGIVGALVGGQIFLALGFAPGGGFLYSLFVSVVGAVIILVAYHALLGRRRL